MSPDIQQRILASWSTSMPFVTKMIMERLSMPNGPSGTVMDAIGNAPSAQSPGAAGGDVGMQQGAQSPFQAAPDAGGAQAGMQPMPDPLPSGGPPRRDNSPV